MSLDRRIKITPPIILFPTEKREKPRVYVIIFFSTRCPHCKKIVECTMSEFYGVTCKLREDTPFYKAIKDSEKDLEIIVRLVNVETEEGSIEADESGVEYIPAIFVNGSPIPIQYAFDYQMMVEVLHGREPPPSLSRKYEHLTFIGKRLRKIFRR